jgi:hypothetical protein
MAFTDQALTDLSKWIGEGWNCQAYCIYDRN